MPVPLQLINLLNLPVPALQRLARKTNVKLPDRQTKWDLALALANLPEKVLDDIVGQWLYAGQTSVTWLLLGDGKPVAISDVRKALKALHNRDPFEEDVRPDEVTDVPSLIDAKIWGSEKIILSFAVTKRVATVIHNFEPEDVYVDEFFLAVLRLDHGVVEVRASHARAQLLANTWLADFAQHLGAN